MIAETAVQPQEPVIPRKRGRKPGTPNMRKTNFKMPKPPVPVKALWDNASPEEKEKAHQTAVALMEYWLGKISHQELAEKTGLPPVRVWQLSKQGLAGLVVGLLKQPKRVPKGAVLPEDDPKRLKKKLAEAERQNEMMASLVNVLKQFPGQPDPPPKKEEESTQEKTAKRGRPKGKKKQPTIPAEEPQLRSLAV